MLLGDTVTSICIQCSFHREVMNKQMFVSVCSHKPQAYVWGTWPLPVSGWARIQQNHSRGQRDGPSSAQLSSPKPQATGNVCAQLGPMPISKTSDLTGRCSAWLCLLSAETVLASGTRDPGPVRGRCAANRPRPRDTDATAEPLCHGVFTSALRAFVWWRG